MNYELKCCNNFDDISPKKKWSPSKKVNNFAGGFLQSVRVLLFQIALELRKFALELHKVALELRYEFLCVCA